MTLYDTNPVRCTKCGKPIGEVDFDAELIRPLCGNCANPLPCGDDHISYTINSINNKRKEKSMVITT